jgi:predicted hotdog family 3-hydroxylacyl-ACP dehydratase
MKAISDVDVEELVRHRGTMLLIDRLIDVSAYHAVAEVTISEVSVFYRTGEGVPAYVGIEYMAQTIAAFDGAQRMTTGEPPVIGFLLGTRRYEAVRSYFHAGEKLTIRANMSFNDGGMASFDCSISVDGQVCVNAALSVYRPDGDESSEEGER